MAEVLWRYRSNVLLFTIWVGLSVSWPDRPNGLDWFLGWLSGCAYVITRREG